MGDICDPRMCAAYLVTEVPSRDDVQSSSDHTEDGFALLYERTDRSESASLGQRRIDGNH